VRERRREKGEKKISFSKHVQKYLIKKNLMFLCKAKECISAIAFSGI